MWKRWMPRFLAVVSVALGIVIYLWITTIPSSELSPDWSPDGKWLAFACNYPFFVKGKPRELRDYGIIEGGMEICIKA